MRTECTRPWRVYRPGIVVGHSETGEMDKIDGPYYFFKLIRRIRNVVPQWVPMIGVEGREINLVPVDFVAAAMDHIAHQEGLDGRAFHLTDPKPKSAGEVIDIFARAAHAPQSSARVPPVAVETLAPLLKALVMVPPVGLAANSVLADFGIPRSVLTYINYPTRFDSRQAQAALEGSDIRVPPLEVYADKLWDYWERHLDPDLFRDRTLVGAVRGRAGAVGGITQIIEQQIPDELLRVGRRFLGTVSLQQAVRGRVVMVTGASSGIGRSAALKIADAGGIVLLVARTAEKLEEIQAQIADGGGTAYVHACDLSDMDDIDRMADEVLAAAWPRRHPDQQRRSLDPALDRPLLRPLPRLRADHPAQLLRGGEADPEAAAGDARAALGPDREHQLDRRADQHPALLGLRGLEGGARRVLALRRLGDRRRGGGDHHDPHAAGANADDQAHQDVRPLPDHHPRGGGRHDLRLDHLPAEAGGHPARDARARSSTRSTRSRSTTS